MDLHMPIMDGEKAFLEIRKYCKEAGIEMPAVVFCTGYAASDVLHKEVAADDRHCILNKPVRDSVLVDALKQRLSPGA
jgi:CheY-like chemotaxis protein